MEPVKLLRLALSVITERLIIVIALSMACGLACFSMYQPAIERVGTLAIFVCFTYLLLKPYKEKGIKHEQESETTD